MYSDYTLVPRLFAISGGKIDLVPSSMHNYRTGKSIPKWTVVIAIAKAFGRTPRFFTEPNFEDVIRRSAEEEQLLHAMKRSGVRNMLLRAAELPDESIVSLTSIVEQVGEILRQHREVKSPKVAKRQDGKSRNTQGNAQD